MVKCRECGAEVSSHAKACPKCGAPPPARPVRFNWPMVFTAFVIAAGFALTVAKCDSDNTRARQAEAAKTHAERTVDAKKEADFQRAVRLALTAKKGMKNPQSFQLSTAILTDAGALCFVYRGTNSFNATVPGYAVLTAANQLAIGSADDVRRLWDAHCSMKRGDDMLYIRNAL